MSRQGSCPHVWGWEVVERRDASAISVELPLLHAAVQLWSSCHTMASLSILLSLCERGASTAGRV